MKSNIVRLGLCALLLVGAHLQAADPRAVNSLLEMRQRNVVIQKWDMSCGAAALATLLNYQHGDPVTERDVALGLINRSEYVENPEILRRRAGFSLLDLQRYVESRGYRGIGLGKLTFEDLVERAPMIVPIRTLGYNHFVVFRGVSGNRALMADPAWGNRTMPVEKFKAAWIDYPELGHVGFLVESAGGANAPNALAPRADDFLFLR